ncbi:MAG: hypothetical protein PHS84_06800 [Paludibacter sp.]|nr:hypothetical protein [Paludibacter sp.]
MKKIQIVAVILMSMLFFTACDLHDTLDQDVIVGNMAPQVYWEIGSSTVTAGSNVPFTAQYYTTSEATVDHLEVWYNLWEQESKTVNCPWTTSLVFNFTATTTVEKRISQKISEYPHIEANWSNDLHAYTFSATFPTSNTLASIAWIKPTSFDSTKMVSYFGADFMQHFKDSLYSRMQAVDFQKMYQGLNLVTNFKIYLDSTYNDNTGKYDYHFPSDANGNMPVPEAIRIIYQSIPFADLILNTSNANYEVEFSRSYSIDANLKAIDTKAVVGTAIKTTITLN